MAALWLTYRLPQWLFLYQMPSPSLQPSATTRCPSTLQGCGLILVATDDGHMVCDLRKRKQYCGSVGLKVCITKSHDFFLLCCHIVNTLGPTGAPRCTTDYAPPPPFPKPHSQQQPRPVWQQPQQQTPPITTSIQGQTWQVCKEANCCLSSFFLLPSHDISSVLGPKCQNPAQLSEIPPPFRDVGWSHLPCMMCMRCGIWESGKGIVAMWDLKCASHNVR